MYSRINQRVARIKGQFEAEHKWDKAPEDVAFLRNLHRHMFFVEVHIELFHEDRELEFYRVKRQLKTILDEIVKPSHFSCEMYSDQIHRHLTAKYPNRKMTIGVYEDDLEGSVSCYEKS